eukprot:CAMPEP_0170402368 /NCGR_PEP_ID=MMETSP0117_2-20130122/25523_1 /TAXON_ID=400756 /ORGANISM="Durinskia baltica, Strain CSIRO CS-38" /LENGTH=102 /DNA_ID=CAMNT_0010659237 /DNA_START=29 /DNA_END=337 /DNA_ORIENTATION=-
MESLRGSQANPDGFSRSRSASRPDLRGDQHRCRFTGFVWSKVPPSLAFELSPKMGDVGRFMPDVNGAFGNRPGVSSLPSAGLRRGVPPKNFAMEGCANHGWH